MRTANEIRTVAGTMRVYRKGQLFNRKHEALHTTGLWYAEPMAWSSAEPAQRGYPSLQEALVDAQMVEDCERKAQLVRDGQWRPSLEQAGRYRCSSNLYQVMAHDALPVSLRAERSVERPMRQLARRRVQ
jgi:hypothetical protein